MKRFLFAGEGLTDYIVIRNLLIGFFKDKNLAISRLLPRDKEPVGWGNVLNYLSTDEFREGVNNTEYIVVQIECWLLPFIADQPAHQSKIVGCVNAVERIAQKQGISINQKNYEDAL
jgi:hypothetical protein